MTWRVLISAPYLLPHLDEVRPRLESAGVEIVTTSTRERLSEAELLPLVKDIEGVICGDDRFTGKVLRAAPRLRVISKWGTGIDSIDRQVATELGIKVCNTPDAFTDPVADSVLGYILSFARRLPDLDRNIREGLWVKRDSFALKGSTLGIVGLGSIGRAVALRARAFGMKIVGADLVLPDAEFLAQTGLTMLPLHALLEQADFVSLHCDLNPTSLHLIGRDQLAAMKPSAYLINTARGPIIDEPALIDALRARRIAGAALDVFEVEPLPLDSPLRAFENCFFAPHNANSDPACRARVNESTIANLLNGLQESRRTESPEN